jgi:hypothetical protein
MVNNTIKIYLLDTNSGVLDVAAGTEFPLNLGVADVRDVTKKTGTFSKTITLADTKNNATLLGHLYDLNAQNGFVFDINKKQRCMVAQNGVTILKEGIFRLMSVTKTQNNLTEDDKVIYEAQITDAAADFFGTIAGRFLTDLDVPNDGHVYNALGITNSWSVPNRVYKYIMPWTELTAVPIKVMHPGIYAKWFFDKIHESAGYNYAWPDLGNLDVRFDKLIIPFNGDLKEVSKKFSDDNKMQVQNLGVQDYFPINNNNNLTQWHEFNNNPHLRYDQILQDPNSQWAVVLGNQGQMTATYPIYTPDYYALRTEYNIEIIVRNNEASNVRIPNSQIGPGAAPIISPAFGMLNINKLQLSGRRNIVFSTANSVFAEIRDITVYGNDNPRSGLEIKNNLNAIYPPGDTQIATAVGTLDWGMTDIDINDIVRGGFSPNTAFASSQFRLINSPSTFANVQIIVRINSVRTTISPTVQNGIPLNTPVDLNLFVPNKIKQSDFLKSICTMFNLYAETDPFNQYRILYKRRDQFYDEGRVLDWTEKLNREKEQVITFLPNLTNKKLLLTYKYDSGDSASKAYNEEVKEVYGQLEYTFANEYVKDIDKQEIIFAPTLNAQTFFSANVPRFQDDYYNPKTTLRILQDGGNLPCDPWVVEEYPFSPNNYFLSFYPFFGHFDRPDRPTYDINFGLPKYLLYNATALTQNNLFWNNWARTITNIETGNMLTAYFWLTEADMNLLRLSDKVRIDNGYYYINKIIDYNAARFQPTKVELITVEQSTNIGIATASTVRPFNPRDIIAGNLGNWGTITSGRDLKDSKKAQNSAAKANAENSSVIQDATNAVILGRNNILTENFSGIIIGNNQLANEPGVYVGDYRLTNEGVQFRGNLIIDGGLDEVLNLNKTNEADFIDPGVEVVRQWGGISNARVFVDGGKIG